jgi:hypothetical protein
MEREMRARMEAEGQDPDAGAVPGSGASEATSSSPAAEPINTDTDDGRTPPESIPYARFKEVNDRYATLRPFEDLTALGYDADSLRRLAEFEAAYVQDPIGTIESLARTLELPESVIEGIVAAKAGTPDAGEIDPEAEPTPPPAISPEDRQRLEYIDQLQARERDAVANAQLNSVISAWDDLDKADDHVIPERLKLMAIAETLRNPPPGVELRTYEDVAKAARSPFIEYRDSQLGEVVRTGNRGTPPLPGSAPAGAPPVRFTNMRQATRAAEEAIARGELPAIQP